MVTFVSACYITYENQHRLSTFFRLSREFQRMLMNVDNFHGVVCVQLHESMEDAVSRTRREIR